MNSLFSLGELFHLHIGATAGVIKDNRKYKDLQRLLLKPYPEKPRNSELGALAKIGLDMRVQELDDGPDGGGGVKVRPPFLRAPPGDGDGGGGFGDGGPRAPGALAAALSNTYPA